MRASASPGERADGERVAAGAVIFEIEGRARPILTGERTALNFLQLLSATATQTSRLAAAVAGTGCTVIDTRKTLPGLRTAQKYAVRCGGGRNHRMGLYDMVLIKENHIAAAGSITAAITAARRVARGVKVEVEVESLQELEEALRAGPDIVLLDDFSLEDLAAAVSRNRSRGTAGRAGSLGQRESRDRARDRRDRRRLRILRRPDEERPRRRPVDAPGLRVIRPALVTPSLLSRCRASSAMVGKSNSSVRSTCPGYSWSIRSWISMSFSELAPSSKRLSLTSTRLPPSAASQIVAQLLLDLAARGGLGAALRLTQCRQRLQLRVELAVDITLLEQMALDLAARGLRDALDRHHLARPRGPSAR